MSRGWRFCRVISILLVFGLVFAGLLITPPGLAERSEPGIQGTVYDNVGSPLEGVEIRVVKLDMSWGNGTYTDSSGEYLVNISGGSGLYLVAFVMDGYFERTQVFQVAGMELHTIDATLNPMPGETEEVSGIVFDSDHTAKMGYEVRLLYEEGNDRHEYGDVTDGEGRFGWTVFPGDYVFEVYDQELAVYSEEITISLGDGPVYLYPVLPDLPPKDVTLKGFVSNGTADLSDVMVGIMDPNNDVFNVTFTDETGYYELTFWEGFHYLICLSEGYEGYFRGLDIDGGSTIWTNVTLKMEEYTIKGVVNGPDGQPVEGVSVQYLQQYVFPESNSDITDADGEFAIDVAGGDGFLIVVEDNPFESGDYDVYFEEYNDLSSNMDLTIDLTNNDMIQGVAEIMMDSWSHIAADTRMKLPVNNSKAGRAMVDMMVGDGNLIISQDEFELWKDAMMGDDSDIMEGPFGNLTDQNLTLNGRSFLLDGETLNIQFVNFTGAVASDDQLELQNYGEYDLQGDEPEGSIRELTFNGSYNLGNEYMVMHLDIPNGWRPTSVTETLHEVYLFDDHVIMRTAEDPDPDDEIDSEWVTLTFHDDTFDMTMLPVQTIKEGEEAFIELNITDHILENDYNITWYLDDVEIQDEKMENITISFPDDGTYEVRAHIMDDYDREIEYSMSVEVENVAPTAKLEILGEENQTFVEGDVIGLEVTAFDQGDDELFIEWGEMGTFSKMLNYSENNKTMYLDIPDDGVRTYQVRITDDDNTSVMAEVTINVSNGAPTFEYEILEEGVIGDLSVMQGENITIMLKNILDPGVDDILTLDWDVPGSGIHNPVFSDMDETLTLMFLDTGSHSIFVNVSDGDGGSNIQELKFMVEENATFDHDGDGLPRWWEQDKGLSDNNKDDALMDHDQDNLSALEEFEKGTDPMNSDTDNDTVPDNWDGYPLNPNRYDIDSDLDGFNDWDEILNGTDPMDKEDYPGKKGDKDDNGWLVYLVLLLVGLILIIGIIILWVSRSKQRGLEYDEE